MRIIIDANIIISAMIRDNHVRKLLFSKKRCIELYSPDFVLEEVKKYGNTICERSGISSEDFFTLLSVIFSIVKCIKKEEYTTFMSKASEIMNDDTKDIPYVACSLALGADGIWTGDKHFSGKSIRKFSTEEITKIIEDFK